MVWALRKGKISDAQLGSCPREAGRVCVHSCQVLVKMPLLHKPGLWIPKTEVRLEDRLLDEVEKAALFLCQAEEVTVGQCL